MATSNIGELQTQVAYLEILNRYPTTPEQTFYGNKITSNLLTQDYLKTELRATTEYLQLQGLNAGNVEFTDNWILSGSNLTEKNLSGLTLANGKIALTSSYNTKINKSYISTNFNFNSLGTYANNIAETFSYMNINLFSSDDLDPAVTITNLNQSLNMQSANFIMEYDVTNSDSKTVAVKTEMRCLRQYPYCTLNTITLLCDENITLDLYHNINANENIRDIRYNNSIINIANSGNTAYFFQANGILDDTTKKLSTCCAYLFGDINYTNKGYNISTEETNKAYNKFSLTLIAGLETSFTIMTSTMTELDFEKPEIETQRILINALTYTIDDIISGHVSEWNKMWSSYIHITGKTGITAEESNDINETNKFIKMSLYNIYSVIRDDINVEINPLNISTIDFNGHIFWSGELWFIPLLTLMKPKAAKSLLDYRYYQLENAIKLASAHGYKGSKFAYENDTVGYKNIYWNSISPLQIFNTGLISIAVWNYYRVSRDLDWLKKKGFEILKNNADFFVSKFTYDSINDCYNMTDVIGMDNIMGDNNILTNYLAKISLKFALEAKYELNYVYAVDWGLYIDKIVINIDENPGNGLYNILKTNQIDSPEILKIVDALLLLHPYYSKYFFDLSTNYDTQTIKDNIISYKNRLQSDDNTINDGIFSTLYGTIAQEETNYNNKVTAINNFKQHIDSLNSNSTLIPWQTYYNNTNRFPNKNNNDVGVSSMFLLNLLTSLIGLRIQGGVDEARFYYQDFGIVSRTSAVLPKHWKTLEVYGVGMSSSLHYCVTNSLVYP